jgi:CheY-like chemotaxis protein/anti-sigma regulatory factor (Ser/Thr protein kinase)
MEDNAANTRNLRVLVVEDEPAISFLQSKALEENGFFVEHAFDANTALNRIAEGGVDVVLLDYQLPGMSGQEVLEKIKTMNPSPPVIMVTGHGDETLAASSIKQGAKDYVVKDPRLDYLKQLPDIIVRVHRQWLAEEKALQLSRELVESEHELHSAKEKAEEYAMLQDKFVSLVAHDLKSPLASMTGLLMILDTEWDNLQTERRREILGRAVESGAHMAQVIEEILSISRLRTGQVKPDPAFLDAYWLIEMAIESMSRWAQEKGVALVNEIKTGSRIYADLSLLADALKNVISNAIKFSQKGGVVTITYARNATTTSVCVKDTGVGMDQDMVSRLFHEETRQSRPGTAGETGTGWGLKYCMDIMTAHKGGLQVSSEKGKGAALTLSLPTVKPVVLIVDDEPFFLRIMRKLTEEMEAVAIEAADGEEALKSIGKATPHLIISDIHMPNLDGVALLERVRKRKETALTPFIILTSDKSIELRDTAFRLGANDFVNKPLVMEDFIPRVKRFIV